MLNNPDCWHLHLFSYYRNNLEYHKGMGIFKQVVNIV